MPPTVKWLANKLVSSFRRGGFTGTLKSCAAEIEEIRLDRKYGIDTLETVTDHIAHDEQTGYSPTKISTLRTMFGELRNIFSKLHISCEDFIFLDVGSGKGRTLLLASEFPFRQIIGVELSPELHSMAERNIRAYRSTTQKCNAIQSLCCDATVYQMPPENTVLFLFNPFKGPIVSRLLTNLRESLENHPRQVYLLYNNPACHDLIVQSGFLSVIRVTKLYAIYRNKLPTEGSHVPSVGLAPIHVDTLGRAKPTDSACKATVGTYALSYSRRVPYHNLQAAGY